MVVKVAPLVPDPDEEHPAITPAVVATASDTAINLNLRLFMRHLL
jgi:hypothetical protein